MILSSLLKVLGISIISCLSFADVDSSLVVHTEEQSAVSTQIGKKNANVSQSGTEYLNFNFDDMENVLNNVFYTGSVSLLSVSADNLIYYYTLNGSNVLNITRYGVYTVGGSSSSYIDKIFFSDTHVVAFEEDGYNWYSSLIFEFNYTGKTNSTGIYRDYLSNVGTWYGERTIVSRVSMPKIYYSGNGEENYRNYIYPVLKDKIYYASRVDFNLYDIQRTAFKRLASWIPTLSSTDISYISAHYSNKINDVVGVVDGGVYKFVDGNNVLSLNIDEYDIRYGIWSYNGEDFNFSEDFYIYTYNTGISEVFRDYYSYDVENNNLLGNANSLYVFAYNFNFNALYQTSLASPVVVDSTDFPSSAVVSVNKYVELPYFYSNGQVFNHLLLIYKTANGIWFESINEDGQAEYNKPLNSNKGYFDSMYYFNSYTNESRLVCYRTKHSKLDSEVVDEYFANDITWVNPQYRSLNFLYELDVDEIDALTVFTGDYTFISEQTSDYSIKNAFSLINTALVGMYGFLGIQLLPGITIGALFLMPIAVFLMLFVINLFKR